MPTLNLDLNEIKKLIKESKVSKEIKKQIGDYEECKWLTGC
jgi:hypothetical protein